VGRCQKCPVVSYSDSYCTICGFTQLRGERDSNEVRPGRDPGDPHRRS
jgi:hypothetical protein